MPTFRCPTCETQFDPTTSRALPFCSDRCRQIDLGRWLREKHSIPTLRSEEDEDGATEVENSGDDDA